MAKQGQRKKTSDTTGRKAEELKKQHAEELAKRSKEMALISADEEARKSNEVIDLAASQSRLAPGTRHPGVNDDVTEVDKAGYMTVEGAQQTTKTNDTEVVGMGPETPFDVPGSTPEFEVERRTVDTDNAAVRQAVNDADADSPQRRQVTVTKADETVEFRVNEDIEDMTFGVVNGMPQNFSLEAGRRYKGPKALVDHLEEKGYIYH